MLGNDPQTIPEQPLNIANGKGDYDATKAKESQPTPHKCPPCMSNHPEGSHIVMPNSTGVILDRPHRFGWFGNLLLSVFRASLAQT